MKARRDTSTWTGGCEGNWRFSTGETLVPVPAMKEDLVFLFLQLKKGIPILVVEV